jgi:hypothetical protein
LRQELAQLEAEERGEELRRPSTVWTHDPIYGPHLVTVKAWKSDFELDTTSHGRVKECQIGNTAWRTATEARIAWLRKLWEDSEAKLKVAQGAAQAVKDFKLKWGL